MRRKISSTTTLVARTTTTSNHALFYSLSLIITFIILQNLQSNPLTHATSIKPADFDRLIMPCYLGASASSQYNSGSSYQSPSLAQNPNIPSGVPLPPQSSSYSGGINQLGRSNVPMGSGSSLNGGMPSYYAADTTSRSAGQARDGFSNLGQQVPRANTIDNFIALVSKIEAANPRLANDPDQLIRILLGRFRMDNYYYDTRARTPISEQDHRVTDIIPGLLNQYGLGQQQLQPQYLSSDVFPEQLLNHDEKCSMYFMLSHFIDKLSPMNPPLPSLPVTQLTGPLGGQRPPVLQAAGSGYPAQSANNAFSGGASGSRYPGPSPSFGSPATNNMNGFGSGISNNPDYSGNNPYGVNAPQQNSQFNQNYNNMRNIGQYSGTLTSNSRFSPPYIDGNGRSRDERQALEFGVVTVANQENAAIVLNRVLMGILAAGLPSQPIRQLATVIYPTQPITATPKIDEEIDPLYAVTLADLWAISSIPKAGKVQDLKLLGDNGRWNDTMCPTSFQLERASSIRFTTAELLGGLDGFNLGTFRRRLMGMRKNIRLSEMLKMYYSKTGFRPQFAEVGVCSRGTGINTQLDELRRQSENYLRLYQLNLPTSDNDIAMSIHRLDGFKDIARQAANQYLPPDICQDSSFNDPYPMSQQDQCEIAKADVVTVLDTSPQANSVFMNLVVTKLAQKLGLSRQSNSLSVLTNQQDTTGYSGSYSFNAIVSNSTNTAEIGCSLVYDGTRSYQGGQITEPTRLMEMFERALVNLDSEYLIRQNSNGLASSSSSSSFYSRPTSYVSSLFGPSEGNYAMTGFGPKNTGGAKVIIWFNYGSQQRQAMVASGPTNWNGPNYRSDQNNDYKFVEAKKYLRENFRGAAILGVAGSREDVKNFVYDEERDIFTDIPQSSGSSVSSGEYYPPATSDPATLATLNGPADQLVSKLFQRMCDIPAVFQYPMCFRAPSENVAATGFISPGRRQYWMMAPKTFFASRTVRMVFRVEGGRLRVCFGRMTKPDESAAKSGQPFQTGSISLGQSAPGNSNQGVISSQTSSSANNYYTGLEYGLCKDVSPGQEIDFIVDDPCYKKAIADCEPFYFVIRETSNPGEGDPNYMCRDEGCKRFDQAKFTMAHTGVTCSSALKSVKANWFLLMISILTTTLGMTQEARQIGRRLFLTSTFKNPLIIAASFAISVVFFAAQQVDAQNAGVYDFGQGRAGEKRGNFTPSEVLAIILLIMTILVGLAFTIGLCYYVSKRNSRGMTRVETNSY